MPEPAWLEKHAALRATARALAIDRATIDVIGAFDQDAVPSILLKGPSIALWLYPGGAGRPYVDSDILVPPCDRARAEHLLARFGFINLLAGTNQDERDPHGTPWWRASDGICVDLHRSLAGVGVTEEQLWGVLVQHTEPMVLGQAAVRVLTAPARALHVALHAAHNGIANPQSIEDLTRALRQLAPAIWEEAGVLARQVSATPSFAAGLRLVPEGKTVAGRLGLSSRAPVEVRLRARSSPPLALGFASLKEMSGFGAKARYIVHNFLPSPAFMRLWSPLASQGRLGLAAAYLWRWSWLVWHAVPGYRAWRRALSQW